jgi:hypothetical protein
VSDVTTRNKVEEKIYGSRKRKVTQCVYKQICVKKVLIKDAVDYRVDVALITSHYGPNSSKYIEGSDSLFWLQFIQMQTEDV